MRRSQYSARAGSIWLAAFMSASAWGQVQKTPDARQSVDDVTLGLKIGEPGRVQVPVMASWKLANGMRVVVGPNAGQPLISGTLLVRAGMLFDPPDRMGLTEIAARALQHGIGEQGGDQKLQKLTQWGAQL